jgi:hypothetical protein
MEVADPSTLSYIDKNRRILLLKPVEQASEECLDKVTDIADSAVVEFRSTL